MSPGPGFMLQSWGAVYCNVTSGQFGHNVRLHKAVQRPIVIGNHPHVRSVGMTTLAYKEVTGIRIAMGESVTVRGLDADGKSIEETIPVRDFEHVRTVAVAPEIESLGRELREAMGTSPKGLEKVKVENATIEVSAKRK